MSRPLVPLRPLAVGELLDGPVAVTRAHPRAVLAFGAALAVVSAVLDLLVTLALLDSLSVSADSLSADDQAVRDLLGAGAVSSVLGLLVSTVTSAVMAGVMTQVVGRSLTGDPVDLRGCWELLRPRLLPLVGLSAVVGLAVYGTLALGLGLLVLLALAGGGGGAFLGVLLLMAAAAGAVALYVRWSLASAAFVLERATVRGALARSAVLVRGAFFRQVGVLLLALAIGFVVSFVVQLPFQLFGYSPFDGLSGDYELTRSDAVVAAVAGAFASTLVIPYSAGVRALLYVDRRVRAEGLDLVLAARG